MAVSNQTLLNLSHLSYYDEKIKDWVNKKTLKDIDPDTLMTTTKSLVQDMSETSNDTVLSTEALENELNMYAHKSALAQYSPLRHSSSVANAYDHATSALYSHTKLSDVFTVPLEGGSVTDEYGNSYAKADDGVGASQYALYDAYNTLNTSKANKDHASSSQTYGVATDVKYGHAKIVDNLDSDVYTDGEVLSAHQGYELKQAIDNIDVDVDLSEYQKIEDVDSIEYVEKSGGTNFNDLVPANNLKYETYFVYGNTADLNSPRTNRNFIVKSFSGGKGFAIRVKQLAYEHEGTDQIFSRTKNVDGNWTAWKELSTIPNTISKVSSSSSTYTHFACQLNEAYGTFSFMVIGRLGVNMLITVTGGDNNKVESVYAKAMSDTYRYTVSSVYYKAGDNSYADIYVKIDGYSPNKGVSVLTPMTGTLSFVESLSGLPSGCTKVACDLFGYDESSNYTDCNIIPVGMFCVNGIANTPIAGYGYVVTQRFNHDDKYKRQFYMPISSNDVFHRRCINGVWDKSWSKYATADSVVSYNTSPVTTLYNNDTGVPLKSSLNLTADKDGMLKVSFAKKTTGYTLNVYINNVHKFAYPNWWGENVYDSANIPVKNGDRITISSDVLASDPDVNFYKIINVLVI